MGALRPERRVVIRATEENMNYPNCVLRRGENSRFTDPRRDVDTDVVALLLLRDLMLTRSARPAPSRHPPSNQQ